MSWLLGVLRRRFLVMAAATIAWSALAGTAIIATSKSITVEYEGSFSLLVEPATVEGLPPKQLNNTQAADLGRINIEGISLVDYETQIRILCSPKMMQPVIEELRSWYPNMNYTERISKMSINASATRKMANSKAQKFYKFATKIQIEKKFTAYWTKFLKLI